MILTQDNSFLSGLIYHGRACIAGENGGIVSINGEPAVRQVLAFRQDNQQLAAKDWSAPDGTYLLPNLEPNVNYIVMAIDYTGEFEPVCYSHIQPFEI